MMHRGADILAPDSEQIASHVFGVPSLREQPVLAVVPHGASPVFFQAAGPRGANNALARLRWLARRPQAVVPEAYRNEFVNIGR